MRNNRPSWLASASIVILLLTSLMVIIDAEPALALVPQPHTSPSHYITNASTTALNSLGASDGTDIGNRSGSYLYILDFGQEQGTGSGLFGGYAMADFDQAHGYPLVSFATIRTLVDGYISNLAAHAGTAPTLIVAIGTNNDNQCAGHTSTCTPQGFGSQLAFLIYCIAQDNSALSSRVLVESADDIENGWDDANRTIPMVQAYNASIHSYLMYDFGDPQGSGWTDAQTQYVAYGAANSRAVPEAYYLNHMQHWAQIDASYGIFFDGIMTQYPGGGDSPAQAWGDFQNTLINAGVGQSYLYYGTNI